MAENQLSSSVEDYMGGLKFKIRVPPNEIRKESSGFREVEVIVHPADDGSREFARENQALQEQIRDCKLEIQELQESKTEPRETLTSQDGEVLTPEEAMRKGREIILHAKEKAREMREVAIREAMLVEQEINKLRALKKKLERETQAGNDGVME